MEEANKKDITLYRIKKGVPIFVRQGIRERQWMDNTYNKFAYRCLPLTIANQNGYEVCTKTQIKLVWNGGNKPEDIHISMQYNRPDIVQSHFGYGIITFHTNLLIRTPKDINTYVTGTPNQPKRGIVPLDGIVETDWNPATFTMNWQLTEPYYEVIFEAWEPFCFFFPIERGYVEKFGVIIKPLDENEEEFKNFMEWSDSRKKFKQNGEYSTSWQKHYFQGKYLDGNTCPVNHQTKIKLDDIKLDLND